jgi:curved DNA-binding protein CbpA
VIQLRFVPIQQWPGEKTKSRQSSSFRSKYIQTLDLLEAELKHLWAKDTVLQAFISWQDVRNDGLPKSNAAFTDPGVILTFESRNGALSFPCDRYTDWQANLRAIALSLEALRAVNRYGVTRRAEQYQGWRQLAPPSDKPFPNKDAAAIYLCGHGGDIRPDAWRALVSSPDLRNQAYRRAAAKLHPDVPGGSHDEFVKLQAALALLEAGQ